MKNYIKKIIKIHYRSNGNELSMTGIVWNQEEYGNCIKFFMLMTNGQEWDPSFRQENIIKITSVRINADLRQALENYCAAKIQQKKFLDSFWHEKNKHEKNVSHAITVVKEHSEDLDFNSFRNAVEDLFRKYFPRKGSFLQNRYFICSSVSSNDFTMSHVQDVCKWVKADQYPFIYQEYDQSLHIEQKDASYKKFCEANAPAVISSLKKHSKVSVSASIGDKNFLTAERNYTFPLKHGLTKTSLAEIETLLFQ